jgi:hypothetical protein
MTEQWQKQKREVDSYNVFFSAFKGRTEGRSFYDLNYRLAGMFVEITDARNDLVVEPDFVLFDGATLLLTEIKSGRNINQRDINQMESSNELSIEAAIEWLRDAELQQSGYDPNGLNNIEPAIVYYNDFIEECRESSGCSDALDNVSECCTVLSQQKGGLLQIEENQLDDPDLNDLLSEGISIPTLVDKHIYLTENVNREILAYSIVHDAVLNSIGKDSEITIDSEDIINRFQHRQISLGKLNDALVFLRQIGACVKKSDEYVFRTSNMSNIMSVGDKLEETTVRTFLTEEEPEEGQSRLGSFADDAESDGDEGVESDDDD